MEKRVEERVCFNYIKIVADEKPILYAGLHNLMFNVIVHEQN